MRRSPLSWGQDKGSSAVPRVCEGPHFQCDPASAGGSPLSGFPTAWGCMVLWVPVLRVSTLPRRHYHRCQGQSSPHCQSRTRRSQSPVGDTQGEHGSTWGCPHPTNLPRVPPFPPLHAPPHHTLLLPPLFLLLPPPSPLPPLMSPPPPSSPGSGWVRRVLLEGDAKTQPVGTPPPSPRYLQLLNSLLFVECHVLLGDEGSGPWGGHRRLSATG